MKLILPIMIALTLATTGRAAHAQDDVTLTSVMYLVQNYQHHPIADDSDLMIEIADAIDAAAHEYDVPALLLVAMAWHESKFRVDILSLKKIGALGERGILQTGPHAVRDGHCNTTTIQGQAKCGARWLSLARRRCGGDVERGLALYASGHTCDKTKNKRLLWRVNARLRLWRRLERRFER
jgi:hypothetical protein